MTRKIEVCRVTVGLKTHEALPPLRRVRADFSWPHLCGRARDAGAVANKLSAPAEWPISHERAMPLFQRPGASDARWRIKRSLLDMFRKREKQSLSPHDRLNSALQEIAEAIEGIDALEGLTGAYDENHGESVKIHQIAYLIYPHRVKAETALRKARDSLEEVESCL